MEDADHSALEVLQAAAGVVEMAQVVAAQGNGHGVQGEIAAAQIVLERCALNQRQRPGLLVGLAPGGGQVQAQVGSAHGGGAEALVLADLALQPLGQRAGRGAGVALDGQVEVHGLSPSQEVAHRSAHQVDRRQPLESAEQPVHTGQAAHPLAQARVRLRPHSRTGIPAARIRSLASRTR